MPKRKRKKIGWVTVTVPKHGMLRAAITAALRDIAAGRQRAWECMHAEMEQEPLPVTPTIGGMHSGISGTSRLQNPMHPVHPAWGHRTHFPTYTIFET